MRVNISGLAEADIEAIADFIAEDNPTRAGSFARELWDACMGLGDTPFRFAQLEDFESRGYRRCIHGRYSIIYRVADDEVLVVRVFSSLMDIRAVLGDD
ncbi:MAG: type II toxin-antitoxin system RelE/ParE family toxin [Devosia sp.]